MGFHVKLVSFKNIDICLIYGPKSIIFGAYARIWAWLSRGHPEPLKSSVTGPSFLVNCYLEIKFYKKIRVKKRMF